MKIYVALDGNDFIGVAKSLDGAVDTFHAYDGSAKGSLEFRANVHGLYVDRVEPSYSISIVEV